jgi:glycosyltransferase involved in cell wall biosynthesis
MPEAMSSGGASPVSVIIAGRRFGYPHGMGATARVHAYAKGLIESGARVRVISLLTPPLNGDPGGNHLAVGVYDGVPFEYACGTRVRAPSFLGRRLLELKVPIGLWRVSRRQFSGQAGPRAIIAYTQRPTWIVFMAFLARLHGSTCVVELCEMPLVYERSSAKRAARKWLLDEVAYRFTDGFIAISSYLEEYARLHAPVATPIIRVPILAAASDFAAVEPPGAARQPREVVYVGDMRWHEGDIEDLLNAFSIVAAREPNVILKLVGEASDADMVDMSARAMELGLENRVEFAGPVQRSQLPGILRAATMLVLLRRDGLFSRAGFPTKLGEYLASGRPVVTTATGDIPRYLSHGISAYLVPSADPAAFADQMRYVLHHPEQARAVGMRGRLVAERYFDYRRHGKRLNAFIRDLQRRRDGRYLEK